MAATFFLYSQLDFADSLIVNSKDIVISSEVVQGGGCFSTMYTTKYCAAWYHGKECVVKNIHSKNNKCFSNLLFKEGNVLATLKHPCIIRLLGIFFIPSGRTSPLLLLEKIWINLTSFLKEKRLFHQRLSILHDVACGVSYIHKKKIIHFNLISQNIVLGENFNAKIANFEQSKVYGENEIPIELESLTHMPPEVLKHNSNYSTKVDVYSFGHMVIDTAFDSVTNTETLRQSFEDNRLLLMKNLRCNGSDLHKIVVKCLDDDPDKRPTAEELHSCIKSVIGRSQNPLKDGMLKTIYL